MVPVSRISLTIASKVRICRRSGGSVAAVDEDTAEEALDLIKVEYEELPAVLIP
jgi:CO/xanthine dehydrogenase Mo-binding subunit